MNRFGKYEKLALRFIRPFEILEWIIVIAYKLSLPSQLPSIHNVFHVSMLWKYEPEPTHILDLEDLEIDEQLVFEDIHVQILDQKEQILCTKVIPSVKVLWCRRNTEEMIWELEPEMRTKYLELFNDLGAFKF